MGFAKPHFNRDHFKDWNHEKLVSALIEAMTRIHELNVMVQRKVEGGEDSYYATGQPVPYKPADGQW